jgi:hypothetical protein
MSRVQKAQTVARQGSAARCRSTCLQRGFSGATRSANTQISCDNSGRPTKATGSRPLSPHHLPREQRSWRHQSGSPRRARQVMRSSRRPRSIDHRQLRSSDLAAQILSGRDARQPGVLDSWRLGRIRLGRYVKIASVCRATSRGAPSATGCGVVARSETASSPSRIDGAGL